MATTDPMVYVANIAAYNASKLIGLWMIADVNLPEAIGEQTGTLGEEYRIDDHSNFGPLKPTSIGEATAWGDLICDGRDPNIIAAAIERIALNDRSDAAVIERWIEDGMVGRYADREEYGYEMADLEFFGGTEMPTNLAFYFDAIRYAEGIEMGGDVSIIDLDDGTIAVVSNH